MDAFVDRHGRPLRSLRLSVTDRCNFRCTYCMPEQEYRWLPRTDILSLEEMARLVQVFAHAGVRRVRFTGGEPLLRREIHALIAMVAGIVEIDDIALTTNARLLADQAADLRKAGLQRLNISLDSLKRNRFAKLTQRDALHKVLEGIRVAREVGFTGTKIDTVMMRGKNDDEIIDLLEYAEANELKLRFIEYMDVGGATQWSESQVLDRDGILQRVEDHYGAIEALEPLDPSAPARIYKLKNGQEFGIIASTSAPFCGECDRSRVAADGTWYSCLYANHGVSLRELLRDGRDDYSLAEAIADLWRAREDRGAEQRKAQEQRGPAVDLEDLLADPRLEMHTRGG
ncbi:MAG: GTP 3',8-cyclase MoaA [Planctomycetota bacterium]|nr:GTP 3',8-cyclase MoaA [Planctomycetota bacterium]